MYWKTASAIGALGIAASSLAPVLYARLETVRLWYDVIGVDVSGHRGHINWSSLAASGVAQSPSYRARRGRDVVRGALAILYG
jgi:hypothetical protein